MALELLGNMAVPRVFRANPSAFTLTLSLQGKGKETATLIPEEPKLLPEEYKVKTVAALLPIQCILEKGMYMSDSHGVEKASPESFIKRFSKFALPHIKKIAHGPLLCGLGYWGY